jgi:hypothetical protein
MMGWGASRRDILVCRDGTKERFNRGREIYMTTQQAHRLALCEPRLEGALVFFGLSPSSSTVSSGLTLMCITFAELFESRVSLRRSLSCSIEPMKMRRMKFGAEGLASQSAIVSLAMPK